MRQPGVIGRGTIGQALLFHIMCLCSTSTPLPSPPPTFYRVSGLHLAVSPLPVHRKLASSDPHQTSCEEAGHWKTSPEMGGGGERSREGVPSTMGVVSSGGLTALNVPNLTYLPVHPPPNIPLLFCWLDFVFGNASCVLSSSNILKSLILSKSYYIIKKFREKKVIDVKLH